MEWRPRPPPPLTCVPFLRVCHSFPLLATKWPCACFGGVPPVPPAPAQSKLVREHGLVAWKAIAKEITGRNTKQCRERWRNYLDPNLKRGKWTPEEDAIIMAMQRKVGNKWAAITKKLPGRTDNQVKIRFNSLNRKETAKQSAEAYLSKFNTAGKASR